MATIDPNEDELLKGTKVVSSRPCLRCCQDSNAAEALSLAAIADAYRPVMTAWWEEAKAGGVDENHIELALETESTVLGPGPVYDSILLGMVNQNLFNAGIIEALKISARRAPMKVSVRAGPIFVAWKLIEPFVRNEVFTDFPPEFPRERPPDLPRLTPFQMPEIEFGSPATLVAESDEQANFNMESLMQGTELQLATEARRALKRASIDCADCIRKHLLRQDSPRASLKMRVVKRF